jgi:hypothetical protein
LSLKRELLSAKTIAAVERLARSDPRLAASVDQWDRDPWLLNTPDGTIELLHCCTSDLKRRTIITAMSPRKRQMARLQHTFTIMQIA